MSGRPSSITVIAWILIGMSVVGLLGYATAALRHRPARNEVVVQSPVPTPIQQAFGVGGMMAGFVCGSFLLRGRNWARLLYVVLTPIQLLFALLTAPYKAMLLPGVAIFLVMSYFLFRPPANAFFAAGGTNMDPPSRPSIRRVLSIGCYVVAGFLLSTSCFMVMAVGLGGAMMLAMFGILLPPLILLSIGRALSQERLWTREIGIVLLVTAACGAFLVLMMFLMFLNPEFQKSLPPEKASVQINYAGGILWVALMAGLGGLSLFVSKNSARSTVRNAREKTGPRFRGPVR